MKKVWQAIVGLLAAAGCGVWLIPAAAALELDMSGLQDHPVRVAIGIACVAVAVALLLYRLLRGPISKEKRRRSYGETQQTGTVIPSYKKVRHSGRSEGGFWGRFVPSYKGGKSVATSASLSQAEPESHKRTSRRSYGKAQGSVADSSYKGGASAAGTAVIRDPLPDSYKEPWGSGKRYGRFHLPSIPIPYLGRKTGPSSQVPGDHTPASHHGKKMMFRTASFRPMAPAASYKGGASQAKDADLNVAMPTSHKSRLPALRFGGGISIHLPASYKGGASQAKDADLNVAMPTSHKSRLPTLRFGGGISIHLPVSYKGGGSRAGSPDVAAYAEPERYRSSLRRRYGVPNRPDEIPIYRGRRTVLHAARVALSVPPSYREPWGSGRRYGRGITPDVLPIYHGGSSVAKGNPTVQELPLSYREPWGSKRRYHSRVERQELPLSYREPWGSTRRYGAGDPLARTAVPERPHYHGGSTTTAKEPWVNPDTGTLAQPRRSNAKQYGNRRYGGKLYGLHIVHYREEEPLDSSTVVHEDGPQPLQ